MINLKLLLNLDDFKNLNDAALVDIAETAMISGFNKDERLLAEQYKKLTLYLLEGTVEVQSEGGVHQSIKADTERAQNPVFHIDTPGHYARCTTACKFLLTERNLLDKYGVKYKRDKDQLVYGDFDTLASGVSSLSFLNEVTALFKSKSITLPSLPQTAIHISNSIDKDSMNNRLLSEIIQMDPVIAARIVQVANSNIDAEQVGTLKYDSIPKAIDKIGIDGVRTIITGVVLRDLFTPETPLIINTMKNYYKQSIRIGVICYELAKRSKKFDPDHAFLIGVLHDIGIVPILVVAEKHPELKFSEKNLNIIINELRSYLSGMLLQQWEFTLEYSDVAKSAFDWSRETDKADYCDLVQVALMHSHLVGGPKIHGPELHQLPAFKRLKLDKDNPVELLQSIKQLSQRINNLIQLLDK